MDWNKAIDQHLLMTVEDLRGILAFEAIAEDNSAFADEVLKGVAPSFSDRLARHQRDILEVLEKGCLLGQVQILRGDKQALHNLCEVRRDMAERRKISNRISFYRTRDTGLPSPLDITKVLNLCMTVEKELFIEVNALEVNPGDVVRWMNSVHEGQALLPISLRQYLSSLVAPPPDRSPQLASPRSGQMVQDVESSAKDTNLEKPEADSTVSAPRDQKAESPGGAGAPVVIQLTTRADIKKTVEEKKDQVTHSQELLYINTLLHRLAPNSWGNAFYLSGATTIRTDAKYLDAQGRTYCQKAQRLLLVRFYIHFDFSLISGDSRKWID